MFLVHLPCVKGALSPSCGAVIAFMPLFSNISFQDLSFVISRQHGMLLMNYPAAELRGIKRNFY